LPFVQKVNVLRKSTKNNLQALVGVHEAGHVLAAMMIIGIVPEYVVSRTVDSESQGFAYTILPDDLETRKLLVDRIKLCLGGYVAEQLIFGKENNTTGVSDDLSKATNLAHQIVREYGMNDEPFKQNIHVYGGNSYNFTFDEVREQAAKEIIENCLADTRACIEKHKPFLLMVADYLSDNSRLDKEELISMAQVYAKKQKLPPFKFISKEEYYDFRSVLKKLVE
jgi:ATP-dependent Zn protease